MQMFVASMMAYLLAEFTNAVVMAKMKIASQGNQLWRRILDSSVFANLVDSIIFNFIGFLFIFSKATIIEIILTEYVIKLLLKIIILPIKL